MVHKHSKSAEQRRYIKKLLLQSAFQDRQRSEIVNMLSPGDIAKRVSEVFDYYVPGAADYIRGEVLSDTRGSGTLQR